MSNNAPDYTDNLVFEPSMPRCDIEELQNKLAHSEKMRDLQAEYACKLEKKLRIAEEALLDIENNRFSYIDEQNCVNTKSATQKELRIIAKKTLKKIKD